MAKELLINVAEGEECRIALLDNGKLDELYMERTSSTSHVGNIYKGRVTNVEPSIQAAFVDFGLGRNGFLHISDLMPTYFGRRGEDISESVGRKMARRDRPPIQRCLRRGDEIIVQIIKEGIGTKGPTLTTYLSIPGRILVMMPGMSKFGISRKIDDEAERKRLRGILDSLKPIDEVGFIIRTAGVGKTKTEIQRDLTYLTRLWQNIEKKRKEPAPVELYTEGDLVTRTVRDVFTSDVDQLIVDNKEVAKRIKEFFKIAMPRTKNRVELYEDPLPLFHKYDIEREIEQMYSRHVPLPSGGSLVIDSTEAIVAIDVNSGKFRDHSDAEMTAFKTDMEAADEIPRQLKLRDLGGVIICDFIDLRYERHRRELEKKLHDNFKNDRAKTKVLRMSQFGIIELTRQRMRPSLKRSIYFDCPHCKGAGLVKTPESMSLDVMRRLAIAAHDLKVARVELSVCPDVSFYLLNKKRGALARLEAETKKRIIVKMDPHLGLDEMKLELFDTRDGNVFLHELGMLPSDQQGDRGRRHQQQHGRRDHRDQRGRGGSQQQQGRPERPRHDEREEVFDIEEAEESHAGEGLAAVAEAVESADTEAPIEAQENGERPEGEGEQPPGGTRRRRRGRRGGRGRNRGGQQQQPQAEDEASHEQPPTEIEGSEEGGEEIEAPSEESNEEPVEAAASEENGGESTEGEGQPKRRRRRRGGRRHRRRKEREGAAANGEPNAEASDEEAEDVDTEVEQEAEAEIEPSKAEPPPSVTRTGSTDRHLVEDEPVEPQPARRPRSYRDLDEVPDDFDD
jgi:ribonuclease E